MALDLQKLFHFVVQDICPNPKLIVNGVSGNDLNQGKLANCWFIASCAALAQKEEVWMKVSESLSRSMINNWMQKICQN